MTMIQQGEWAEGLTSGMRPDDFIKKLREEIERKVPEEFEHSLHIWLEARIHPHTYQEMPSIRFQWERPETAQEQQVRFSRHEADRESRRKTWEQLKKEFGGWEE